MLILSGQAFFSVKKGEKFTVKTTMGEVIVLGTKFDVLTSANVMVVGCHEGKVRVSNEKESVIIEKGEGVQLAVNGYMNRFEVEDIEPKWLNGIEQFNDVPLYKVIEQMRRYFNIHHVCTSDELYRKFNGTLSTTNPQELTNVLAPVMNISCRIENNDIYMFYK